MVLHLGVDVVGVAPVDDHHVVEPEIASFEFPAKMGIGEKDTHPAGPPLLQPLPSMGGGALSGAMGGCRPRGAGPPNRLLLLCRLHNKQGRQEILHFKFRAVTSSVDFSVAISVIGSLREGVSKCLPM